MWDPVRRQQQQSRHGATLLMVVNMDVKDQRKRDCKGRTNRICSHRLKGQESKKMKTFLVGHSDRTGRSADVGLEVEAAVYIG